MRLYIAWQFDDELVILGEVVATEPLKVDGFGSGDPTGFARALGKTAGGYVLTPEDLANDERGPAAVKAWADGDDRRFLREYRNEAAV